jgi:uncharacterized protein YndB with AHSA1/START domain
MYTFKAARLFTAAPQAVYAAFESPERLAK